MTYSYDYPMPAVTTDAVIFNVKSGEKLYILLIQRLNEPFKEKWALPGGFIEPTETLEECVVREIEEETGLSGIKFHQLGAFSQPDRDPRQRVITVAFWGFSKTNARLTPGSDALTAKWFPINKLPEVAFDHNLVIKKALVRALEIMAE